MRGRNLMPQAGDVLGNLALLAVLISLLACGPREETQEGAEGALPPDPWFEEVAVQRGLTFTHRSGHRDRRYLMPESAAGGAALADFNGDGFLDAYLIQSDGGNRLYRGLGDGSFKDVTAGSGADDHGYGMGVATGDADNDGDVDLYVTNVGPNVLLRNDSVDGQLLFTDVTTEAGTGHPGFGSSAAFIDVDHDGDLDLFAVNYLVWSEDGELDCWNTLGERDYCNPASYDTPAADVLYRNDTGPDGNLRFTDISREVGLGTAFGNGLGVVAADFDGDRWIDVFIANDATQNQLWINDGAGAAFQDRALLAGCAMDEDGKAKAGMGVVAEDLDDDGDPDLLVMNLTTESDSFYLNEGSYFADRTAAVGLGTVSRKLTRFGLGLADFDNDGQLDLYEATGRVARQAERFAEDPYAEPDLLFRGTARRRPGGRQTRYFEEVLPRGGTATLLAGTSRAAAFGDIDNDGGIDVLVAQRDGPAHLLRNLAGDRGHWILLRVLEEHGRDALGARVRLKLGDRQLTRDVRSAYSYCAANDPRVHIGLGRLTEVREVMVDWPNGTSEAFGDFAAGQIVTLSQSHGRPGVGKER